MRRVERTRKYLKDLKKIPQGDQESIETTVDKLEGEWMGLDFRPLQGIEGMWRLRIGNYRVFCRVSVEVEHGKQRKTIQVISAEGVERRGTTTYRKSGH